MWFLSIRRLEIMSKIDRLCELREQIVNALGNNEYNVGILINTEEDRLSAIYHGYGVCKIVDYRECDGTYHVVFADNFALEPCLPQLERCKDIDDVICCIIRRIIYYNKRREQRNMVKLEDLRDYLNQEIGNIVSTTHEPEKGRYGSERVRVYYDGRWVCSIYKGKYNNNLFNVIFYDPFICRSAGYSPVVNLTAEEIPRAIKNRINICEGTDNTKIDVNVDTGAVDAMVYAYMSRGNGKTQFAMHEMFKKMQQDKFGPFAISDVIFNNPATIVFWADGTKTVVKCQNGEEFDPEKGLAMAIAKKIYGGKHEYYEVFAKFVGRYNKKRFNKALEEAKKITPDEVVYNGKKYVLADQCTVKTEEDK